MQLAFQFCFYFLLSEQNCVFQIDKHKKVFSQSSNFFETSMMRSSKSMTPDDEQEEKRVLNHLFDHLLPETNRNSLGELVNEFLGEATWSLPQGQDATDLRSKPTSPVTQQTSIFCDGRQTVQQRSIMSTGGAACYGDGNGNAQADDCPREHTSEVFRRQDTAISSIGNRGDTATILHAPRNDATAAGAHPDVSTEGDSSPSCAPTNEARSHGVLFVSERVMSYSVFRKLTNTTYLRRMHLRPEDAVGLFPEVQKSVDSFFEAVANWNDSSARHFKGGTTVCIHDLDGRQWLVLLEWFFTSGQRHVSLNKGWAEMCGANGISVGKRFRLDRWVKVQSSEDALVTVSIVQRARK